MDSVLLNSLHPDHTFFLWAALTVLQSMLYHCNRIPILAVETQIKWGNADLGPSSRPSPPSLKSCLNLALISAIAFHPLYYGVTKTQRGDQIQCHPRNTQYIMFQIIGRSTNIWYDHRDHHILSTVKFRTRSDAVPSPLKTRIKVTLWSPAHKRTHQQLNARSCEFHCQHSLPRDESSFNYWSWAIRA